MHARQALVHSLIDVQVADLLEQAVEVLHDVVQLDSLSVRQLGIQLDFSPLVAGERIELQQFLFDNVYRHPQLVAVREQAATRVRVLYQRLLADPRGLPRRFADRAQQVGIRGCRR